MFIVIEGENWILRLSMLSPTIQTIVSKDVTFNEQESYFKQPHILGKDMREEDEPLKLPNLTLEPTCKPLKPTKVAPQPTAQPAPEAYIQ